MLLRADVFGDTIVGLDDTVCSITQFGDTNCIGLPPLLLLATLVDHINYVTVLRVKCRQYYRVIRH